MKTVKILIICIVFLSTTIGVAQKTWSNNRYTFNNDQSNRKLYLDINNEVANSVKFWGGNSIDYISLKAPDLILDGDLTTTGTFKMGNVALSKNQLSSIKRLNEAIIVANHGKIGIGVTYDFLRTDDAQRLEVDGNIASKHATMGTFGSRMTDGAYFANKGMNTATNYALAQDINGNTYLNAKEGAVINFLLGHELKMKLYANGNFGIGTVSEPTDKFEVKGNIKSTSVGNAALTLKTMDNTQSNGIAFQNSGNFYTWNIFRKDTGNNNHADLVFASGKEQEVTNLNEILRITTNGNVGIGTNNPTEKLDVDGNAKAKGVTLTGDGADSNTIDSNINGTIVFGGEDGSTLTNTQIADSFYPDFAVWVEEGIVTEDIAIAPNSEWDGSQPDYVFEIDYELPTLEAVEAFVKMNKHLEGIPSKAEVAEKGWSLPSMDQKLLKKIEELTLYTIQQEKEIKDLRAMVDKLVDTIKN